jgi:hypothetical protein
VAAAAGWLGDFTAALAVQARLWLRKALGLGVEPDA